MSKVRLGSYGTLRAFGLAVYIVCALVFFVSCGDSGNSSDADPYNAGVGSYEPDSAITTVDTLNHLDTARTLDTLTNRDTAFVRDTLVTDTSLKDTSENKSQDTTAKEQLNIVAATVTGAFAYGLQDTKSSVFVQWLDKTFSTVVATYPALVPPNSETYTATTSFVPPYARAIFSGTIADLVHGGTVAMPDSLYALVGLQGDAGIANINFLTFFKSVCMQTLLMQPGANAEAASAMSSAAVWNMFHIDTAGLVPLDSIASFTEGESGAALLAATVMMLSVLQDSVANPWKVAEDFADGSWDDPVARAKIADWAFGVDVADEFDRIERNVKAREIGKFGDFKKYIRAFYQAELGISECNEANAGKIVFSTNPSSKYYASAYSDVSVTKDRFICDSRDVVWREATDRERDTYEMGEGTNGEIRQGLIDAGNLYRYGSGSWRAVTSAADIDAYFVDKSNITDFVDIKEVYESIKDDERVIFLLRHGERDKDATSKNSGLTKAGIDSAKAMGAKLTKFDEPMRLGASEFYRAQQTVIAIAQGRGQDTTVTDTFPELNDDWYMIDRSLVNQAESEAGGGWEATSYYTYTGRFSGDTARIQAYYNLNERSAELIEILLKKYQNEPDRFIMLSSHDKLMVPFVAYCSKLRINMNIRNNGTWINYLAGIAIIWDKSGNRRYVAFKGLRHAYFQGW